jgi:hypothetical protein
MQLAENVTARHKIPDSALVVGLALLVGSIKKGESDDLDQAVDFAPLNARDQILESNFRLMPY